MKDRVIICPISEKKVNGRIFVLTGTCSFPFSFVTDSDCLFLPLPGHSGVSPVVDSLGFGSRFRFSRSTHCFGLPRLEKNQFDPFLGNDAEKSSRVRNVFVNSRGGEG